MEYQSRMSSAVKVTAAASLAVQRQAEQSAAQLNTRLRAAHRQGLQPCALASREFRLSSVGVPCFPFPAVRSTIGACVPAGTQAPVALSADGRRWTWPASSGGQQGHVHRVRRASDALVVHGVAATVTDDVRDHSADQAVGHVPDEHRAAAVALA